MHLLKFVAPYSIIRHFKIIFVVEITFSYSFLINDITHENVYVIDTAHNTRNPNQRHINPYQKCILRYSFIEFLLTQIFQRVETSLLLGKLKNE